MVNNQLLEDMKKEIQEAVDRKELREWQLKEFNDWLNNIRRDMR